MGAMILVVMVESRLHRQISLYFFLQLKSFLSDIFHVLNLATSYQSSAEFRNREPGSD
jgi:hypothetical protein